MSHFLSGRKPLLFCSTIQTASFLFYFFKSVQCVSERFQGALHWVSFTFNNEQNVKLKINKWDRSVISHFLTPTHSCYWITNSRSIISLRFSLVYFRFKRNNLCLINHTAYLHTVFTIGQSPCSLQEKE